MEVKLWAFGFFFFQVTMMNPPQRGSFTAIGYRLRESVQKMNCKSYIPGYYTMRGPIEHTGNSWPIFFDNKVLNGHLYNGCMFSSLNGYSENDKEMLKRTMLEHEAIFRKQVCELHRLYKIQKDLMGEYQRDGLYRFSTWEIKSKTSLSSSEAQSQVTRSMWKMSYQPTMSCSRSRETATVANTNVSPISTLQSCFGPLENGTPERHVESKASIRESTKRMFDLRLPADVYIDTEGTERSEKEDNTGSSSVTTAPYSRKCNADPENEVKLTLANVSSANGREGAPKSDSHRKNSLFHGLADLNEPIKDTSLEGTAYSFSSLQLGPGIQQDENHRPNGSVRSTNLWLQISSSKNRDCDETCSSSISPKVKKELSKVCSQFHNEAGQSKIDLSPNSCKEKCLMYFEPIQQSLIKANDIILSDHNKEEAQLVQKKGNSLEIPRKSSDTAVSDNPEKLASSLPHSFIITSSSNINAAALPQFPTWMKPSGSEKHPSDSLQTISSLDKSTTKNNFRGLDTTTEGSSGFCHSLRFCRNLNSHHLENGKFSHQNGFNHGFHRDSSSRLQLDLSYNNPSLNAIESSSVIRDGVTAPKNKATSEVDGDCEELSTGLFWLNSKPSSNESLNLKMLSPTVALCFSASGLGNEGEVGNATESSLNERQLQVDELKHGSFFSGINSLEKESSAENTTRSFRNHIDLNCQVAFIDDQNFSKMSENSQVGVPSQTSDSLSSSKGCSLDAPVTLEEKNIPEIESTLCSIRNFAQQNGCLHDMLIREAAENMIKLSVDKFKHSLPFNITLHWFADVALLNANTKKSDIEMDHFELMTLQLEEMKPEEVWCRPEEAENGKDDEKSRVLLLLKKPRRGQARKRRQRRDFQKDTLPGLATLSRKEVVEDLQVIGELMKASGCHWEVCSGRRFSGQNCTLAKARRRGQPRNTTFSVTEEHSRPQQTLVLLSKNANNPAFEIDRPGMIGWGTTMRRCRRPRCPPQSITTALT